MLPQDRISPGQDKLAQEISSDLKEQFDSIENCPKQAQAELDSSKVQRDDSSKNKMAGIFFGLGMNVVWSICPLTLGFTYKYTNIKAYEVIYWKSIFMNIANLLLCRYHYLILPTKKENRKPVSVLEIPEDCRNIFAINYPTCGSYFNDFPVSSFESNGEILSR
ncbi:unnamed protein product [Moneuplotes crassus]|uniref:Uncharacterized protein n=1 Tax=Euplotes crassus TaxID=5936 RepID=A0AAD1UH96_EUPCR|nr:unnamed protein product [Moneuplotes crassus]